MKQDDKIVLGYGESPVVLEPSMAMRHGLIAGATGTGKTTTLKVLAEGFSDLGVPVFVCDAKGDLSGLGLPGRSSDRITERLTKAGIAPEDFALKEYPVRFWDAYGKQGIPWRMTISDLGPSLLSRLLDLTPAQAGVLQIVFKAADERGWQLDDLKDLQAMIQYAGVHRKEFSEQYGNVSSASTGAIARALLELENQGGQALFGLPALEGADLLSTTDGQGTINVLECAELINHPRLYSALLLWLLAELNEILPEAGALEKPKLMLFFDEAHMIFDDAPKVLVDSIAQTVRLIRSKGVGIFFISQTPSDLPDSVLSQLTNRIVHSLHAYTPAEQKALKAAAAGFRENPAFRTIDALQQLPTGYALVSTLDPDGVPSIVQQTMILPCQSSFDALGFQTISRVAAMDPLFDRYGTAQDPQSAYEWIEQEKEQIAMEEAQAAAQEEKEVRRKKNGQSALGKAVKSAARSSARSIGRQSAKAITRSIMGSKSKSTSRQVENFAGNLVSSLIGSLIR